jgi:hypothetical protein
VLEVGGFADDHDFIALLQGHRGIRIAADDAVATNALDPGRQPIRTERIEALADRPGTRRQHYGLHRLRSAGFGRGQTLDPTHHAA